MHGLVFNMATLEYVVAGLEAEKNLLDIAILLCYTFPCLNCLNDQAQDPG